MQGSGSEAALAARGAQPGAILRTLLWLFAAGVVAAGAGANLYWILGVGDAGRLARLAPAALPALAATAVVLLANVALRWVRWHFLTRRAGVRLAARDSLLIFLGTLPAVLTPFYLGELVRAVVVGKRQPEHRWDVAFVWLVERSSDLLWVAGLLWLARGPWLALAAATGLFWLVVGGLRSYYRVARGARYPGPLALVGVLALSGPIALLPALSLWTVLALLGSPTDLAPSVGAYAHSALVGTFSGLPLGISVTGSSLVLQLQGQGLSLADAVAATWVFRVGSVWFAVAFGVLVALAFRRELLALWRPAPGSSHFDDLAHAYEAEIPAHVRERLVERKIRAMRERLAPLRREGRVLRGLDVGCGPGWYALAMAREGHRMVALDASQGQVATARHNAERAGVALEVRAAGAEALPLPDAQFDFAYAINVMHHIEDEEARRRAFAEIVRVLRPGGVFFLQEINTENPLFRFYMGYVFPLVRAIDEGTERWISPRRLPPVAGARWADEVDYFTFLPDFLPPLLQRAGAGLERTLERSRLRSLSAHYVARLVKEQAPPSGARSEAQPSGVRIEPQL